MKVRIPGNKFAGQAVRILEHELRFAANGLADAEHLTDEEIQRCVRMGFEVIHGTPAAAATSNRGEKPETVASAAVDPEEAENRAPADEEAAAVSDAAERRPRRRTPR